MFDPIPGLEDYSNRTLQTMMATGILDHRGPDIDYYEVAQECVANLRAELAGRHHTIADVLRRKPVEAILRRAIWKYQDINLAVSLFWQYCSVSWGWQLNSLHRRLEHAVRHDLPIAAQAMDQELIPA